MSCSQLAARWPRDGLGCQLASALAVADGRLQVVPMGSVTCEGEHISGLGPPFDTGFEMGGTARLTACARIHKPSRVCATPSNSGQCGSSRWGIRASAVP
eukprot:1694348-Prymnesium_polylepis.1